MPVSRYLITCERREKRGPRNQVFAQCKRLYDETRRCALARPTGMAIRREWLERYAWGVEANMVADARGDGRPLPPDNAESSMIAHIGAHLAAEHPIGPA